MVRVVYRLLIAILLTGYISNVSGVAYAAGKIASIQLSDDQAGAATTMSIHFHDAFGITKWYEQFEFKVTFPEAFSSLADLSESDVSIDFHTHTSVPAIVESSFRVDEKAKAVLFVVQSQDRDPEADFDITISGFEFRLTNPSIAGDYLIAVEVVRSLNGYNRTVVIDDAKTVTVRQQADASEPINDPGVEQGDDQKNDPVDDPKHEGNVQTAPKKGEAVVATRRKRVNLLLPPAQPRWRIPLSAAAAHELLLTLGADVAMIDGRPHTLPAPLFIDAHGRSWVPLSLIAESFGAVLTEADDGNVTLMYRHGELQLQVGSRWLLSNGRPRLLHAPITRRHGVVYVPLRALAELHGLSIYYDADRGSVRLWQTRQHRNETQEAGALR